LKRLAMVPNTGISSGGTVKASRLRCTCLATSRSASAAPLRSNLLMATNSAKSSMSIFSSWLAAPNSGVITYSGTSTSGTMAASPWPMPEVSTIDQVEAGHLAGGDHVGQRADLAAEVARGQRAHEHARALATGRWRSCGCGRPAARRRSCAGSGRC
jgi:hypothetical protein